MGRPSSPLPFPLPKLSVLVKGEIESLYSNLSSELSNLNANCDLCGKCCYLDNFGHELWLSGIELAYLFDTDGKKKLTEPGICPYLKNKQCIARTGRTMGCRIFHCKISRDNLEKLFEKYINKMRAIAEKYNIEFTYGELLASLCVAENNNT